MIDVDEYLYNVKLYLDNKYSLYEAQLTILEVCGGVVMRKGKITWQNRIVPHHKLHDSTDLAFERFK